MKTSSRGSPAGRKILVAGRFVAAQSAGQDFPLPRQMSLVPFVCCARLSPATKQNPVRRFWDTVLPPPEHASHRFEHYEIVRTKRDNLSSWVAARWALPTRQLTSIFIVP